MKKSQNARGIFSRMFHGSQPAATKCKTSFCRPLRCEPLEDRRLLSVYNYYVDFTDGLDSNAGTEAAPWKTVGKVNGISVGSGNSAVVHFQRGEVWREQLIATSNVTYMDYGDPALPKPQLLGSTEQNDAADWVERTDLGENIWSTKPAVDLVKDAANLLPNPSFSDNTTYWTLAPGVSGVSGARDTASFDTDPASYKVTSGSTKPSSSTKLYTQGTSASTYISVTSGKTYQLTFSAKCGGSTSSFTMPAIQLLNSSGSSIGTVQVSTLPTITTAWTQFTVAIKATSTNTNARISFTLGGTYGLGANSTFNIDSLSFSPDLLSNTSFRDNTTGWAVHEIVSGTPTVARTTSQYHSGPGGGRVYNISASGTNPADTTLDTTVAMPLQFGKYYLLTFWAKTNTGSFDLAGKGVELTSTTRNASNVAASYTLAQTSFSHMIITTWTQHKVVFQAGGWSGTDTQKTDGMLRFYLGGTIPAGRELYIDDLSLRACATLDGQQLPTRDVGNVIFNNDTAAMRRWLLDDAPGHDPDPPYPYHNHTGLHNQGDYFYDAADWSVKVYSTTNPAAHYDDIELATTYSMPGSDCEISIIELHRATGVTVENLDVRYGAYNGISGIGGEDGITIRGCNVSYIGGMRTTRWDGSPARIGNGIQFWFAASDCVVEGCTISEIFDTAITPQSGAATTQTNLTFVNNVIWNCEMAYEYFSGLNSYVDNVRFENNTCAGSGYGWSHAQRHDLVGIHLRLQDNGAASNNFSMSIRNNIFYGATEYIVAIGSGDWGNLTLGNNVYYQFDGRPFGTWMGNDCYTLSEWQAQHGKDANSIAALPWFADAENHDYHVQKYSPAVNAGCDNGVAGDFNGTARPWQGVRDIGAYEYQYLPVSTGLVSNWRLDESSGTVIDSYGTNDGLNSGANQNQEGILNTAYWFENSNSVAVPKINCHSLTVSAWFWRNAQDATNADAIFGGWYQNDNTQLEEGYELRFDPNSNLLKFIAVTENGSGARTKGICDYAVGVGTWCHAVGTYDAASGEQILYVNGLPVDMASHTVGNTMVPLRQHTYMTIGDSPVGDGHFNGLIDDVKVFRRALDGNEVRLEYQNGHLTGYWALDENVASPTYAYDDTLRGGRDGTPSNTDGKLPGQVNRAYYFDGSGANDDHVILPVLNHSQITVSAWIKRTAQDAAPDTIFSTWHRPETLSERQGYELRIEPAYNTLQFIVVTQNSQGQKTQLDCTSSYALNVGTWYYVTASYNKATHTQTLYINGDAVATNDNHPAGNEIADLTQFNETWIGKSHVDGGQFAGYIDEVKLFSRALTTDEINAEYVRGYIESRRDSSIARWRMDETTAGPVVDSYGGNHGANAGAAISQSGQVGTSYYFDVYNRDNVKIPRMNYGEVTVAAWFNRDVKDTMNADAVFGGVYWENLTTAQGGYELRFGPNSNALDFIVVTNDGDGGTKTVGVCSSQALALDTWYYAVGTYDKATGVQTLYIDGQPVDTASHTVGNSIVPVTEYDNVWIGYSKRKIASEGSYFTGYIDDVRIYGRALGDGEVADSYQAYIIGGGMATVESITVNDGDVQRSSVTEVDVAFDSLVTIDAGAFDVVRQDNGQLVDVLVTALVQDGRTVARLTFCSHGSEFGSLANGDYRLTINADKIRNPLSDAGLDGDGDGKVGGNRLFGNQEADAFFRRFGDSDGDRDVDIADLGRFRSSYLNPAMYLAYFDFDSDGDIDILDLGRFRQRYLK